jgi:2-dehydro-3-deoxyglucarate aldolase/4-hydroxy-2-oxoheptanedioate aldolase
MQGRDWHSPTLLAWFSLGSLAVVDIAMSSGAEIGVIDLQHGLWDRASAHSAIGIIGQERSLVRSADSSDLEISRALDTGAAGVIVPMVENREMAANAVAASRFPPEGRRSAGGVRPLAQGFGAYLRRPWPTVAVMIETAAGLEKAEEIASVEGVDFVFIGTGDLSLSLQLSQNESDALDVACASIRASSRRAGRPCGIFTPAGRSWSDMLARGFTVVTFADDIGIVSGGFSRAASEKSHLSKETHHNGR